MKRRLDRVLLLALVLGVFAIGCSHVPGGISASSTPIEGRAYTSLGKAVGTDSHVMLFGIIPIKGSNSTRAALDAAVASRGGDAMINVTVESYAQFWVVFTRRVITIEGDVIRFAQDEGDVIESMQ
jgi:hypothetical protein